MATVSKLNVEIGAKDRTKRAFSSVANAMKKLKKGAAGVAAGVAALAASLVYSAKKAVDFGDKVAKTADRLGIGTKALQELRFAADLAGISNDQFDSALGRLSKTVGDLRLGQGTLYTALKRNDKAFLDQLASTTDNGNAFRLLIEKMSQMGNIQDKNTIGMMAFGRAAGLAMSKISSGELERGVAQAQKLGIAIDDNLLREAEKIKDALTAAGAVFKKEFFTALLEQMQRIDVAQMARDFVAFAKGMVDAAMSVAYFFGILEKTEVRKKIEEIEALEKTLKKRLKSIENLWLTRPRDVKRQQNKFFFLSQQIGLLRQELVKLKKMERMKFPVIDFLSDRPAKPTRPTLSRRPKVATGGTDRLVVTDLHAAEGVKRLVDQSLKAGVAMGNARETMNQWFADMDEKKNVLRFLVEGQHDSTGAIDRHNNSMQTALRVTKRLKDLQAQGLVLTDTEIKEAYKSAHAIDFLNLKLQRKKELLSQTYSGPMKQYIERTKTMRESLENF